MKRFKIFLIVTGMLLALLTGAQTPSRLEKQLVDLSSRKFIWLIEKRYDSLESLLDERVMYVHSNGWIQNKKELIDDLKSDKLNYLKVTVKESSSRLYDQTAIVNGLATFDVTIEGKPFAMDLRYTEVYIKKGNQWKLATRHANRMP